jgi:3-oxoadipate enol-lactonase
MWEPQVQAFAGRFRVIRYDSRGHGRSDVPPGPYAIEQHANDLLSVLDALEIGRAHVCGLSLGGMVALWLSIHRPDRVQRAIFADTAARIGTEEMWNERIEKVRAEGMRAVREPGLARFFSEPFRQRHRDVVRQFGTMLETTPAEGYIAACAGLRDADLRHAVSRIRIPALVIGGELDVATPPSQARELHAAIPGSELVTLKQAAHLSNVERPDAFNAHALAFLGRAD